MNTRKEDTLKRVSERIQEIKKKIQKAQTQIQQHPRIPPRMPFALNYQYNFNFYGFGSLPLIDLLLNNPSLKPINQNKHIPILVIEDDLKPRNPIDNIPILVGIDEQKQKEICTICLQELNEKNLIQILKCNHLYHNECLKQWLTKKPECPTCRHQIR